MYFSLILYIGYLLPVEIDIDIEILHFLHLLNFYKLHTIKFDHILFNSLNYYKSLTSSLHCITSHFILSNSQWPPKIMYYTSTLSILRRNSHRQIIS